MTRWFPGPNRSVALSIASTGLSLGGVLVTPTTAYLFNTWGVPQTMPWLGLAFAGLIIPVALWVVRMPGAPAAGGATLSEGDWTYATAIRTRFFIMLAIGYVFCLGAQVGGIAHLYNRVDEIAGFQTAASAVQALTLCSILGRFVGGWLVMRLPIRAFAIVNLFVQMTGLLTIGLAGGSSVAILGAAILGISVGNLLMIQPLWLAEAFPGSVYPRVFALANACAVAGVAMGPFVLGVAYDQANYAAAYSVAMGVSVLALVFIALAGKRPVPAGELV